MGKRLGVDVGGTFTDLVFYDDESGDVVIAKGLTTPEAPDRGVASIVSSAIEPEALRQVDYFLHGTTAGLNALLTRGGATVGLITTAGFRDVLELRRGVRAAMYDVLWQPQPPLVPRRLRRPIRERMLADGTVHEPIDLEDVRAAAEMFVAEDVDAVAICFINAYANPDHEIQAAAALRAFGFEGEISASHMLSREYREYERTSTTVIDAYVRPTVSAYLHRLRGALTDRGFGGEALITRSGGGSISFEEAETRPVETIMSGPVAGAVGAGELCRSLGIARAITADVGGTSFDTCFVVDGRPTLKYEGEVADMPILTPWVDVRSIGAGGGSIAYVDAGGLLRVGPQSAGAAPGPVCYARGGTRPTTTDAAAALGMLAYGELAGDVVLDLDAAKRALTSLGDELGLELEAVASGILTIASAAMARAIRSVTVEQGEDPRDASLIAFGGAGPLFATMLASELEIREVVVPPYGGNFSAWGLLGQDVTRAAAVTRIAPLGDDGLADVFATLEELFVELEARSRASQTAIREAALDLRYEGQEHSLTTPLPLEDATARVVTERFSEQYERTFGHTLDTSIEVVSVRATTREALPRGVDAPPPVARSNGSTRSIEAFSMAAQRWSSFAVFDRDELGPGEFAGPAIVLEPTTTTYIDAGFTAEVLPGGTLILRRDRALP